MLTYSKVILSLLLLIPSISIAEDKPSTEARNPARIAALMDVSQLNTQIEALPTYVQQGFDRARAKGETESADMGAAEKALLETLDAGRLKEEAQKRLAAALGEEEIAAVQSWFDSPLGRRIAYLEAKAARPAAVSRMRATKNLLLSTGSSARETLLQELDEAAGITASATEMLLKAEFALSLALSGTKGAVDDTLIDGMEKAQQARRPEMTGMMKEEVMLNLRYTCQMLMESEIREYIAFVKSPAGSKYHSTVAAALADLLADSGKAAARKVSQNRTASSDK